MTKKELESILDAFANKIVEKVIEKLSGSQKNTYPEFISSAEAADILGVSRNYLLAHKEKYAYKKIGTNQQSRILFDKAKLYEELAKL